MLDPQEHRRRVYHEAGHAIVAMALGMPLRWIQLGPTADAYECKILFNGQELTNIAVVLMAGSLGSWIGEGSAELPPFFYEEPSAWRGAAKDYQFITDQVLVQRPHLHRIEQSLIIETIERQGKDRAWTSLNANRLALLTLGETLMGLERMEGTDALAIVEPLLVLP